eukprot:CAMPEP_0179457614 /NCGR_PEP_ID=MMETSP0799-20121207/41362_1 /TAXON_ID=46947 /ORGANISM="Geminigera cryophila, Strain CCMP2564" /LENGTH=119 /DNA_ID=CAMNT_0021258437 /DNA_START=45 /DNA_END=401 /DNA_ORIENTATION=+
MSRDIFAATGRLEMNASASLELALTHMATVERRRRVDVCDVDELRVVAQGLKTAWELSEKHGLVGASMSAILHLARVTFMLAEEEQALELLRRYLQLAVEVGNVWCATHRNATNALCVW